MPRERAHLNSFAHICLEPSALNRRTVGDVVEHVVNVSAGDLAEPLPRRRTATSRSRCAHLIDSPQIDKMPLREQGDDMPDNVMTHLVRLALCPQRGFLSLPPGLGLGAGGIEGVAGHRGAPARSRQAPHELWRGHAGPVAGVEPPMVSLRFAPPNSIAQDVGGAPLGLTTM